MHRSLISVAVLVLASLSAQPATAAPAVAPTARAITTQLPRSVRPSQYDVAITPDAERATFTGKVTITLDVLTPTASITLNAADLAFNLVTLTPAAGGAPLTASTSVDAAAQTATFTFAKPLVKGRYRLALDYRGIIGQQAIGLFSLDYDTQDGKKRALYTQFENSDARRMIPSWDEPASKASFTFEATVPAGQMALSNMPIARITALTDGRKRVAFAPTPRMSTYLLFFGLGEFERVTANADGTELGVITTRGGTAQAAFALESTKAILAEYNRYFGVRYPLPKLDNIAAPGRSQFFGAMENWGAIFTFEHAMLLDPAISTQADKQEVFATAAHEMAHQWFGDLVTMQWWDDLWLNEGFASWMESRMTAQLHPEWHTALNAVNVREHAMARDSVATTHPVVQHVETVEQANQAFDDITYQKGESVIRMLENYVGPDAWRSGVRAYMREHAYKNTVSDDLWRAIEKAARKPITAIAHDFTLQPGVPLIRVEGASCKGGNTRLELTQSQFSRDVPDQKPLRWRVPVTLQAVGSSHVVRTLVVGGKASVTVPGCGAVIVNAGQSGYYRTLYAPANFSALAAGFANLAPIDQMGVLSDSWSLGLAGLQPASNFLDLASAATPATDPQVWGKIANVFLAIHGHYNGDNARRQRFDTFAIARLAPVLQQIGWVARENENATIANLRAGLIGTLSALGDPATVAEARRRYAAQATELPAAIRKTVMAVVAEHADATAWARLHSAALAEKSPMIKDQLYDLLASVSDATLARRALTLAMTDEPGVTNSAAMLAQVAHQHPEMAFDFALANIDKVHERVDASSRSRYFPRLAAGSSEPATIAKLNDYANAHLAAGARRDADTAIVGIRDRIKVREGRLPMIDAWLATHAQ
ncbi:MAG: M1 family metallopeptidase [Massilia sp.]|nr:M1 family metallopeptidase [Massilia sp.]